MLAVGFAKLIDAPTSEGEYADAQAKAASLLTTTPIWYFRATPLFYRHEKNALSLSRFRAGGVAVF
jgi:hypothetical protein